MSSRLPVIFLTAHSEDDTLQRAKLVESLGYILKPFEDRELKSALEITLYRHRAELEIRHVHQRCVHIPGYLEALCAHLWRFAGQNAKQILLEMCVGNVSLGLDQAVPCGLIVNELVTNALQHAFPDGRPGKIRLSVYVEPDGPRYLDRRR